MAKPLTYSVCIDFPLSEERLFDRLTDDRAHAAVSGVTRSHIDDETVVVSHYGKLQRMTSTEVSRENPRRIVTRVSISGADFTTTDEITGHGSHARLVHTAEQSDDESDSPVVEDRIALREHLENAVYAGFDLLRSQVVEDVESDPEYESRLPNPVDSSVLDAHRKLLRWRGRSALESWDRLGEVARFRVMNLANGFGNGATKIEAELANELGLAMINRRRHILISVAALLVMLGALLLGIEADWGTRVLLLVAIAGGTAVWGSERNRWRQCGEHRAFIRSWMAENEDFLANHSRVYALLETANGSDLIEARKAITNLAESPTRCSLNYLIESHLIALSDHTELGEAARSALAKRQALFSD